MASVQAGDIAIRRAIGVELFELHDAVTGVLLATSQTLREALDLPSSRGGAIWRQNTDNRGRTLGDPVLLHPRVPAQI
jgi:hypothetical protein